MLSRSAIRVGVAVVAARSTSLRSRSATPVLQPSMSSPQATNLYHGHTHNR